jgi:DNA-binding CsgD family transcriptional regulator
MSSVPKIAAARVPAILAPDPPPRHLQIVPPADPRLDILRDAALEAEAASVPVQSLATQWQDYVEGRLRFCFEHTLPDRILLVARECSAHSELTPDDASILRRVLYGVPQKVLSIELGVAVSTLSSRYNRALTKLGLARRDIPLPLVLAAQCSAGIGSITTARAAYFEDYGSMYRVISVPAPVTRNMAGLTRAEQQVAQWIIEGCSRNVIGRRRGTSVHTTSRQFHSIFARLHVSGRFALIRRALELGCFDGTP